MKIYKIYVCGEYVDNVVAESRTEALQYAKIPVLELQRLAEFYSELRIVILPEEEHV